MFSSVRLPRRLCFRSSNTFPHFRMGLAEISVYQLQITLFNFVVPIICIAITVCCFLYCVTLTSSTPLSSGRCFSLSIYEAKSLSIRLWSWIISTVTTVLGKHQSWKEDRSKKRKPMTYEVHEPSERRVDWRQAWLTVTACQVFWRGSAVFEGTIWSLLIQVVNVNWNGIDNNIQKALSVVITPICKY